MNIKYYKEDDLLTVRLSKRQYKVAEKVGPFIIHYDKNRKPILLEILNASKLLSETSRALPREVRKKVLAFGSQ